MQQSDASMIHELICKLLLYQPQLSDTERSLSEIMASSSENTFVCVSEERVVGFIHIAIYHSLLVAPR